MRLIVISIFIVFIFIAFSCKDKVICPAFQSTYILNDSIRRAKFSLFGTDSLPKHQVASRRNKYGIDKNYGLFERQRRNYVLMTSPKENVLGPPAKDSLFILKEDILPVSNTFMEMDSLQTDSIPELITSIPKAARPKYKYRYNPKFPYNQEQEYYNKYFGKLFIDNRSLSEKEIKNELEKSEQDSLRGAKKKGNFISNFFKKKKQKENIEESKDDLEDEIIDLELEEKN